jgi:hypothetical protein
VVPGWVAVADHHPLDSGLSLWGWSKGLAFIIPTGCQSSGSSKWTWFPCAIITPANDGMRPLHPFLKNKNKNKNKLLLLFLLLLVYLISLYCTVEILKYSNLGEVRGGALQPSFFL